LKHFQVRNWTKFQHYKNRNPPWIKLHTELLENYEFARLPDASKLLAVCIWLLAARSDNRIPADPIWIQSKCNLKTKPDLQPLIDLHFIEWIQELPSVEQDASKTLASCQQNADSEERRDRGEREAESASAPRPITFNPQTISGLNVEAWNKWLEHRSAIKKPIRPHAMQDAAEQLAKLGDSQLSEVKRAVAAGWQGIHPDEKVAKFPQEKPRARAFPS
jgi:hypothetical protein